MHADLLMVVALLAACVVMFTINRPRTDVVGLFVVACLPLTGVVSFRDAIAGFSDPNIMLIALLFVLGDGLVRTGVARRVGDWIATRSAGSETRLVVLLMLAAAGLGAVMSSTAVVAIFIPVVLRICAATGRLPRILMMPLSVAALCSGMLTLIATSPNLLVNAELVRETGQGFGFFSITPVGVPILFLAVIYMLFARRLLARSGARRSEPAPRPSVQDWIARYDLPEREFRVRVRDDSALAGATLRALRLREEGINILAIERVRRFGTDLIRPTPDASIVAGDILMLDVQALGPDPASLLPRLSVDVLALEDGVRYFTDRTQRIGMVEVMVPAESPLVGRTVLEARQQSEAGVTAIGLRRGAMTLTDPLLTERLRVGDTLLLFGFWPEIEKLRASTDYLVPLGLPAEFDDALPAPGRALQAAGSLAVTVALIASGVVPAAHAALLGCLLLGALRCTDMRSAYRAISWQTLVLIAGMMPFSLALQRTGGVALAADAVTALSGEASVRVALALIFVITSGLGLLISNTATAILMAPVALAVAADLGASPRPFAMIVSLAASTAFMTPIASPVNTLVVAPGGYAFPDFVRVGAPLAVICLVVAVALVPVVLPP